MRMSTPAHPPDDEEDPKTRAYRLGFQFMVALFIYFPIALFVGCHCSQILYGLLTHP